MFVGDNGDSLENPEKDNRNLVDGSGNQKLSRDDIEAMKKGGVGGHNIVEQLIENSATFSKKTDFAQEKYIKKKKKKYLPVFTVLRPTTRLLAEMYFNKGPLKICNLRVDSLAQILNEANVRAHNKLIVMETCLGLVLGAVMERMAGEGVIINFFTGTAPSRPAVDAFSYPDSYKSVIYDVPLDLVHSLGTDTDSAKDSAVDNPGQDSAKTEDTSAPLNGDTTSDPTGDLTEVSMVESERTSRGEADTAPSDGGTRVGVSASEAVDTDSSQKCVTDVSAAGEREETPESRLVKGAGSWKKRKFVSEEDRLVKRQLKAKTLHDAKVILAQRDMDGLIVASRFHPTPVVLSLIDYVAPSRPLVVFCQHQEPLLDCYMKLKKRGGVVLLKLTETWLREYQVLPSRTHPQVNMSGTGGYLLTGTVVERTREEMDKPS
ncbi:hypothetical protein NP493_1443g00013 [Ridgeia piscesae]|uniref:tRNA (adenine(58)-N(1))-methyltransferase non-catalytic subunit TRM6 n=1 Tax=Ridgeia piscesae TaxID=27915 RepID=A0AAD9K3L0_RIDPI|nr:hypothetical protein NP493_1443g00013 [Ridgeia piscesae]